MKKNKIDKTSIKQYTFIFILVFALGTSGILIIKNNKTDNVQLKNRKSGNGMIPFDLQKPDKKIKLSNVLYEISALTYYNNEELACLQDEYSKIFLVNYLNENVKPVTPIGRKGDFEGIEIVGNTAFMLKSNGLLIKITDFTKETRVITKIKTGLSQKNDCEGLGYDHMTKQLLIVCKNDPNLPGSSNIKSKRAVYAFDIKSEKLNKKPAYIVDLKELQKITGKYKFMPSGISVNPITNNIYLIASFGKLMIVLNRSGQVIDFKHLDYETFRQPEGICFSPDGNKLFISNEGRKKKGNILIFDKIGTDNQ